MKNENNRFKEVIADNFRFISNKKSLFFSTFLIVMIVGLVNSYFDNTMKVSDVNNIKMGATLGPSEFIRMFFNLAPFFFLPILFARLTRPDKVTAIGKVSLILTPLKRFRFIMMLMTTITLIPMILFVVLLFFGNITEKAIEYGVASSDMNSSSLETKKIDEDELKKIEVELVNAVDDTTKLDIIIASIIIALIVSIYINYYATSSVLMMSTNAGVIRSLICSIKSYYINFNYILLLSIIWIASIFVFDFYIAGFYYGNDLYVALSSISKSFINTFIIFTISYVLFRRGILNKRIVDVKDYTPEKKFKFFGRDVMLNEDVSFTEFKIKTVDKEEVEEEVGVVKNKLRH